MTGESSFVFKMCKKISVPANVVANNTRCDTILISEPMTMTHKFAMKDDDSPLTEAQILISSSEYASKTVRLFRSKWKAQQTHIKVTR